MTPERANPLTKRTILRKLSEESVHEMCHDMVFGYPPMLEEDKKKKPVIRREGE